ncbi:LOW QUALITY PROTEIN: uncharacterized protein ACR2FA_010297 [Aphomia sociella]
MNNSNFAYCRLCAELTSKTEMADLEENNEDKLEIINKLSKLNINMDICGNALPKTVCFACINSLDVVVDFVTAIEHAQKVLNDMLLIKIEEEDSISDNQSYTNEVQNVYDDEIEVSKSNIKLEIMKSDKPQSDFIDSQSDCIEFSENTIKLEIVKSDKPQSYFIDGHSETPHEDCLDKGEEKMAMENVENSSDTTLDHLKATWKDYSWTCAYCVTQFQSVDDLKVHSMWNHKCCNVFKCADCKIRKLKLDSFIIHVKSHRKDLKLSCYSCYATFSTPHEVNLHESTHATSEYSCHGCNTMFEDLEEMNCHTATYFKYKCVSKIPMVNSLSDNLTCVLCKKSFKYKRHLNAHLLIHTERKKDYTCKKCGKCFLNKQGLAGHMTLHNDSRPFICDICKATFKTRQHLRCHIGIHDTQKTYACDQCGKRFRLQTQLSSHRMTHISHLPYVCTYCYEGFQFESCLHQHKLQHTGVKPYSCEVCQCDFTSWSNYNEHMKGRHGTDMSMKKQTPDGVYSMNFTTGEVIMYPETNSTVKKKVMVQRRSGRPSLNH